MKGRDMHPNAEASFYVAVFLPDGTHARASVFDKSARSWPTEEQAVQDIDRWARMFRTDRRLSLGVVKESICTNTLVSVADLHAKRL